MKINREQFKKIVKECLVEILNEGLVGAVSVQAPMRHVEQRVKQQHVQPPQSRNVYSEAVKHVAGGDPTLASILADTAATTMPGFMAGERNSALQTEQINGTPEQVFGEEATAVWEHLAFSAPKPSQMSLIAAGAELPPPQLLQPLPSDQTTRRR